LEDGFGLFRGGGVAHAARSWVTGGAGGAGRSFYPSGGLAVWEVRTIVTKGKGIASRMRAWYVLAENLRPHIGRFPQLADDLEELAAMHEEARGLAAEIMRLRGEAQRATGRLRRLARRADMLRTRMGAGLKSSLGFEADELIQYGFRPRRAQSGEYDPDAIHRNDVGETAGESTGASPGEISGEPEDALSAEPS